MHQKLSRRRLLFALGLLGVAAVAVFKGRDWSISRATAQPPAPQLATSNSATGFGQPSTAENATRVVAYIYETMPLTRGDFGEYLIARLGKERVENFINHYIIEVACRQKGVEVTAAEVEAEFATMLAGLHTTPAQFEKTMLKPYNKTLYEWKEDAIRPRLLLTKLCRERVHVAEEELHDAFEAHYGEKVACRIIMWPKNELNTALRVYATIRDSQDEFERASRAQASATLAARGGNVDAFGRHSTGNEALEKAAFSLREGELSQVLETPEGPVVVKCIKHLPPQADKSLTDLKVREELNKEVYEKKLQLEIQKAFAELRAQANPKNFFSNAIAEEDLKRQVIQEFQEDRRAGQKGGAPLP